MAQEPLVLVLEDEFLLASFTGEILEDKGFAVVTAGSTSAALRVLDDLNERLSALFLDIHFKDGTTSFEVARTARRRFPRIAVLYTSGVADGGYDKERVPDSRFVPKPYDTAKVADLLKTMTAAAS